MADNENEILICIICIIAGYLFAKMMAANRIGNNFSPEVVMSTALDDMNNSGCCVSNTAGYSIDPVAVSPAAPGYSTVSAFSNPCMGYDEDQ